MHLPALIRKSIFSSTGLIFLSDTLRNHVYTWVWQRLINDSTIRSVTDIGSRDSLFPAFLSWRGYVVRSIEQDVRFIDRQRRNAVNWQTQFTIQHAEFSTITVAEKYDSVCSLFSLQHAGANDINAYRQVARHLRQGGVFFSAVEFNCSQTRIVQGRDDGTLRIYNASDVDCRISLPLLYEGVEEVERCYLTVKEKIITAETPPETSAVVLMMFRRASKKSESHSRPFPRQ